MVQDKEEIARVSGLERASEVLCHEINSHAACVQTYFEDGADPDEEVRKIAAEAIGEIVSLIKRKNIYHKVVVGGYSPRLDFINITKLCETIISINKKLAATGVSYECVSVGEGDIWIQTDEMILKESVSNLVSNSRKNTADGLVKILIQMSENGVKISVIDTGIGLSEEVQAKLFQPYATNNRQIGIGLGLYTTKLMLDALKSTILYKNNDSKGCTFIIDLVCKTRIELVSLDTNTEKIALQKIMIIDDTRTTRRLLALKMSKTFPDAMIHEVENAEQALSRIDSGDKHQLYLVDQHMETSGGVMKGSQFIKAAKLKHPGAIFIGVSGNDEFKNFTEAGTHSFF